MKHLLAVLALPLVLASCSKVEELDKRTKSMESATSSMSGTTKGMSDTTDRMKEVTSEMYKQIRQKEAEDTRNKKLDILKDDSVDMGQKLTAASVMYKSFEYQLWTGKGFDSLEFREDLMLEAMDEFYRNISDVYSNLEKKTCPLLCKKRIDKISPLKLNNNDTRFFYALATTMHMNNSNQTHLFKTLNIQGAEETSLYDIIKSALIKDKAGAYLTASEEVAVRGQNKEISLKLLDARVNFLTALAVKDMSTQEDMGFKDTTNALIFKITGGTIGKLTLDSVFEEVNNVTKMDINSKLVAAIKTRSVLKKLEYNFELDKSLNSIIKNLAMDQVTDADGVTTEFLINLNELKD